MGFLHALEVLHALTQVYECQPSSFTQTLELPYPHLQLRLQQTIRGVMLVAVMGVVPPLVLLSMLPRSGFEFPGFVAFVFISVMLIVISLTQLLLRYVLMPSKRPFFTDRTTTIDGVIQTLLCATVDGLARIYQEPQVVVLFTLCVFTTWIWKTCFYAITSSGIYLNETVWANYSTFVFVGGAISFISLIVMEKSMVEDPFALDPRAAFQISIRRDLVRAFRRGVLVWVLAKFLLVVFWTDESSGFFSMNIGRAYFHVVSSVVENFVTLSTSSMFRIMLFRPSYDAVHTTARNGILWDSLEKSRTHDQLGIDDLFAAQLPVASHVTTPLHEQYVQALRKRFDGAIQQISSRTVIGRELMSENVEHLDNLFKFENLMIASRFDASTRELVFSSEKRWKTVFSATTAVVDAFSLSLQLLNAIPERKSQSIQEREALKLEQSLPNLMHFLRAKLHVHPLLLLDQCPHLSTLHIPSTGYKSKIQYYIDSRAQFAVRRFLMEEAKRRVFISTRVVQSAQELLCHLVSSSRMEDKQGNVQHAVPAVLSSLVECRKSLDLYTETCMKNGTTTDVYVQDATSLANGIDKGIYRITDAFYGELSSFTFPPGVKTALEAYITYSV